jgi:hypothetical protein
VNPVRAGGEGDVEPVVHEEELAARVAATEVLLAEVDRDTPGRGPDPLERGLDPGDELRSERAVGDQVDNGESHL